MRLILLILMFPILLFANGEVISPNMSLTIPTVGVTTGPIYATDINNSLLTVDKHDHTPGHGVPITPSGLNINTDLTCQSNNITNIRAARFSPLSSTLSAVTPEIRELYVVGGDLYYNDAAGNIVRITQSGAVTGSAGTISGLPNGTASASYSGVTGTYSFNQATSTPGHLDFGSYIMRYAGSYASPAGNFVMLQAPSTLATGYSLTFPTTLPGTTGYWMTSTTDGVLSWTGVDNSSLLYSSNVVSIKDSGVTTAKIAANAVTDAKIQSGGLSTASIGANQITDAKIQSGGLATASIANNAITDAKIQSGGLNTASIAANAVTDAKIQSGGLNTASIAANAVTDAKIQSGGLSASSIASGAITDAKIQSGGLTSSGLATNSVTTAKITDANVTSGKIQSSVNLAGTPQGNSLNLVVTGSNDTAALKILRGSLVSNAIAAGSGYTYSYNSSNKCHYITFNTVFSDLPSIVVSNRYNGNAAVNDQIMNLDYPNNSYTKGFVFCLYTQGAGYQNTDFDFIAIGQR